MADRLTIALVEQARVSFAASRERAGRRVAFEVDYAAQTVLLLEAVYLTNLAILGCLANDGAAQDVIRAAVPK